MTTENSLRILSDCHTQMTDRLCNAVKSALDETDDVLFNLVKNTGSTEHSIYFEAMREIRKKRVLIESAFRDRYLSSYEIKLRDEKTRYMDAPVSSSGIDDTLDNPKKDIEEVLAVNNSISRIRRRCGTALLSLDTCVGLIFNDTLAIKKELYPASPEIIFKVFHKACAAIETKTEARLILLKIFEKNMADIMEDIYIDLEKLMKSMIDQESISIKDKDINTEKNLADRSVIKQQNNHFIAAAGEVRKQISLHLGKAIVPIFIKDFLFNHWSKLLLKIYLRGGLESNNWLNAIEVVDDIVLCVGNESSLSEKKEFSGKLQYLVQRLSKGMNAISVTPAVQSNLITGLIDYHKDLIREKTKMESINDTIIITNPTHEKKNVPFFNELLIDKNKH